MSPSTPSRVREVSGAIAVAALMLLPSCNPSQSGGSTASNGGQSILQKVVQSGTLRIATVTGDAPFESIDASGKLVGYDIDVATLLATKMGVKPEFVKTDIAGRVTVLQTGKADITVGAFTRNQKRSLVISFTDPINLESVVLIASTRRTDLNKISDFNQSGIKIAVPNGSTAVDAVRTALPKATVVLVPGTADLLAAVESGQADGANSENTAVNLIVKNEAGKIKAIPGALSAPQEDCIGLPLGDFAWWLYVNQFVHDINSDGTTYTLYQKWFGPGSGPGPFSLPPPGATG